MSDVKRGRQRNLSDPLVAKAAAVELVKNGFNTTAAMRAIRPELSGDSAHAHGYKLLKTPEVIREVEKLMAKSDRTAKRLIDESAEMWDRLKTAVEKGEDVPRYLVEVGLACHRVLAKALITDSGEKDKGVAPTMSFGNTDSTDIANLTGVDGAVTSATGGKRVQ